MRKGPYLCSHRLAQQHGLLPGSRANNSNSDSAAMRADRVLCPSVHQLRLQVSQTLQQRASQTGDVKSKSREFFGVALEAQQPWKTLLNHTAPPERKRRPRGNAEPSAEDKACSDRSTRICCVISKEDVLSKHGRYLFKNLVSLPASKEKPAKPQPRTRRASSWSPIAGKQTDCQQTPPALQSMRPLASHPWIKETSLTSSPKAYQRRLQEVGSRASLSYACPEEAAAGCCEAKSPCTSSPAESCASTAGSFTDNLERFRWTGMISCRMSSSAFGMRQELSDDLLPARATQSQHASSATVIEASKFLRAPGLQHCC